MHSGSIFQIAFLTVLVGLSRAGVTMSINCSIDK